MAAHVPAVLSEAFETLTPYTSLEAGIHVITDAIPSVR